MPQRVRIKVKYRTIVIAITLIVLRVDDPQANTTLSVLLESSCLIFIKLHEIVATVVPLSRKMKARYKEVCS